MRGYGDSDKPQKLENYALDNLIEDTPAIIRALGQFMNWYIIYICCMIYNIHTYQIILSAFLSADSFSPQSNIASFKMNKLVVHSLVQHLYYVTYVQNHYLITVYFIVLSDILGYEKATVVGHDWGGAMTWLFASRYPEMCEKVVILNCPHPSVHRKRLTSSISQFLASW